MIMTEIKVESVKKFWQLPYFLEMPRIQAAPSSFGSVDELGNSQRRHLTSSHLYTRSRCKVSRSQCSDSPLACRILNHSVLKLVAAPAIVPLGQICIERVGLHH